MIEDLEKFKQEINAELNAIEKLNAELSAELEALTEAIKQINSLQDRVASLENSVYKDEHEY